MTHYQFKVSMFTKLALFVNENGIKELREKKEINDTIDRRKSGTGVIEFNFINLRSEKKNN